MDENEKTVIETASPKKIEALWDCVYCGQKGIGGLKKHCPNCGHPQDDGINFYMPSEKNYLDEETAAKYGQGADWDCPYCGSMNRYSAEYCANCGAPKEESKSDYFTRPEKKDENASSGGNRWDKEHNAAKYAEERQKRAEQQEANRKKRTKRLLFFAAALIILLAVLVIPRSADVTLSAKSWTRTVNIEAYTTVQESGWSVPSGGRIYSERQEVHHYDQVLDHYEPVEVQKSRTVQAGYETKTSYKNNGDGTFTEVTEQVPRYVTEYYTVTEQQPVYRQEPVYGTMYYYDIDKWVIKETAKTSGTSDTPYWPDLNLAANEREGSRGENYVLTFQTSKGKTYTATVSEQLFNSLKIGDKCELEITSGRVTQINSTQVG